MGVYYHYTTPEAAKKIIRSGVIKKSSYEAQNGDAAFGDGVYLTQVPPTAPRQWIAFNNYDGLNQTVEDAILKGEHCSVCYAKLLKYRSKSATQQSGTDVTL